MGILYCAIGTILFIVVLIVYDCWSRHKNEKEDK
jgi:hypothetical protein